MRHLEKKAVIPEHILLAFSNRQFVNLSLYLPFNLMAVAALSLLLPVIFFFYKSHDCTDSFTILVASIHCQSPDPWQTKTLLRIQHREFSYILAMIRP